MANPNPFTPEEVAQILEAFFAAVGTRQYVGARYVPIFGRKGEESIVWDNTKPYEPLTIVLYQGNSYTSRQYVPAGVEITNEEFWAETGNYNAQVEQYRQEVQDYKDLIDESIAEVDEKVSKAQDKILVAYIMMRVAHTSDWRPRLCVSKNGIDWNPVNGSFEMPEENGEASRPFFKDGLCYFVCRTGGTDNKIAYYVTSDFETATYNTINADYPISNRSTNWTPQIIEDENGDTYIISTVFTGNDFSTYTINESIGELVYADSSHYRVDAESVCYILKVNIENGVIEPVGSPRKIDVYFNGISEYAGIDYDILYWNGLYHLMYRDTRFYTICHATATNVYGPYTIPDYNNLAVFKDVELEAPVMTVINDRVYVNYQTLGRVYGTNLLMSTADFTEWDFVGYPRRIDKNQFTYPNASSHGERPRNIAPQVLPNEMISNIIKNTVFVETGGFTNGDFGITVQPESALPFYNAYYSLSGLSMCPCMPFSVITFADRDIYNEHFVKQRDNTLYIDVHIGFTYPRKNVAFRVVKNTNKPYKLIFWNINSSLYFGGAGTQILTIDSHISNPVISESTLSFSMELTPLIENCPVRAFMNVPPNGAHIEIKIIRKSSTAFEDSIPINTNLFRLPFRLQANKYAPAINPAHFDDIIFEILTTGYIRNSRILTNANVNTTFECNQILTQWNGDISYVS